jgi:hypothetical protein
MNEECPIGGPLVLGNPYKGIIEAIADKVIDAALVDSRGVIVVEICGHPSLNMTQNIRMEREYWCSDCHKKIIIPNYTLASMSQSDLAGIVGIVFGARWKRYVEEGQV